MKKYLLILAFLLALAVAIVLVYFGYPESWIAKLPAVPAFNQAEDTGELDELDTLSWKNYTDPLGTFSLKYPNTWTYQASDFHVSFKKENSNDPFLTIVYDRGEMKKSIAQDPKSYFVENLTIGSNNFTKILMTANLLSSDISHNYMLKVGGEGEASLELKITSKKSSSKDPVVQLILSNIRTNPERAAQALQTLKSKELDAQAKAAVSNLTAQAQIYYAGNKESYAKMCANDAYFKKFLSTISAGGAYCNSSATQYVLSAKIPSGEIMCIDSTFFSGIIKQPAEELSCIQTTPAEAPEENFETITR